MRRWKQILREEGSFPLLAIIMIALLIFTGMAFLKWGADESWQSKYKRHQLQAYYAAHAGMMHKGFTFLRNLTPSTIPPAGLVLGGETVTDFRGNGIATVEQVRIDPSPNQSQSGFNDQNYLDVVSYGRVQFKDYDGKTATVKDSLRLKIRVLGLSNFLYLTNIETTVFGEVIKFWHEDTLNGWVHSNDTIAIMENPVFYDHVSTTAPDFWHGPSYNPQFVNFPPMFNYREIYLPSEATTVRSAAEGMGLYFNSPNDMYDTRLIFNDIQGWKLWQWMAGTPFDSTMPPDATGPPPTWQAIFVDGYLEMAGVFRGQCTVGASGSHDPAALGKHCIKLLDDIKYYFADPLSGQFNDTTGNYLDILGIVSEGNITIANSWANGRLNQQAGSGIVITAAMVALGESFSFEDQNEPNGTPFWEFYTGWNCPTPPNADARGTIYMHGAVTQYRRGYVHRSNHGGTGYGKQYRFDRRLSMMSPPFFLEATDSQGHAHFEIISWGKR
jgi:hypothetical protein